MTLSQDMTSDMRWYDITCLVGALCVLSFPAVSMVLSPVALWVLCAACSSECIACSLQCMTHVWCVGRDSGELLALARGWERDTVALLPSTCTSADADALLCSQKASTWSCRCSRTKLLVYPLSTFFHLGDIADAPSFLEDSTIPPSKSVACQDSEPPKVVNN